ncbi:hypothetical protein AJ80_03299 [Polytolypa hystricis UAMH7299]|uniref:DUF7600 domain-containing protein n=1 Tax=Polytolypa hystricis (strain UAMH7299) TaxID=1447883 RepID=A0A2B7YKL3_POLH7|nr:hypothetical protein AJ80_03299 [Polytolypa hystricis UAMH7299]
MTLLGLPSTWSEMEIDITFLAFNLFSQLVPVDTPALGGFILAVWPKGIHGLRIVTASESLTPWIGSHDQCPKSRRLVTDGPLTALEAGFDGFKIVSLAVGEESTFRSLSNDHGSLRNRALWFPEIPSPDLCLGETCVTGQNPTVTECQPLCWVCFGGPGGNYLRSLEGITIPSRGQLEWIQFHYPPPDLNAVNLSRGRPNPAGVSWFAIDGEGGEIIESVEIQLLSSGKPKSFKASVHADNQP